MYKGVPFCLSLETVKISGLRQQVDEEGGGTGCEGFTFSKVWRDKALTKQNICKCAFSVFNTVLSSKCLKERSELFCHQHYLLFFWLAGLTLMVLWIVAAG